MTTFAPLPPVQLRPEHRVFLGNDPADGHKRVWSSPSDSVGLVGPPRYGKTSGILLPALLYWAGPAVSATTRGDILHATGDWRRSIAAAAGGRIYVYDPFDSEHLGSAATLRWSPLAGCADASVCYRRVHAMTAAAGGAITDADHWRAGAALILRGYFHAAALAHAPLAEVRRWIARQEVRRPAELIHTHGGTEAWAD